MVPSEDTLRQCPAGAAIRRHAFSSGWTRAVSLAIECLDAPSAAPTDAPRSELKETIIIFYDNWAAVSFGTRDEK